MNHILMKSQQNDLLKKIKNYQFDPHNFIWSDIISGINSRYMVPRLTYDDSNFYYQFDYSRAMFLIL